MIFNQYIEVSSLIQNKRYSEALKIINNYYKPFSCLDLINKLKEEYFKYNKFFIIEREIDGRSVKLNLEYDNFLPGGGCHNNQVSNDSILSSVESITIGFPNILDIQFQFKSHIFDYNIVSIIKTVVIQNGSADITSPLYNEPKRQFIDTWNIEDCRSLFYNLPQEDIKSLTGYFIKFIEDLESIDFIKIGNYVEKLSYNLAIENILNYFTHNVDNLQEIKLHLMRNFNFSLKDFNEISYEEVMKYIKTSNKILTEEMESDNNE